MTSKIKNNYKFVESTTETLRAYHHARRGNMVIGYHKNAPIRIMPNRDDWYIKDLKGIDSYSIFTLIDQISLKQQRELYSTVHAQIELMRQSALRAKQLEHLQAVNQAEKIIKEYPDNWIWFQHRWNTPYTPPEEEGKADEK